MQAGEQRKHAQLKGYFGGRMKQQGCVPLTHPVLIRNRILRHLGKKRRRGKEGNISMGIIYPNLGLKSHTSKSKLITVYSMCSQWEIMDTFLSF